MAGRINAQHLKLLEALGSQTNLLDRAITYVSPAWGGKRLAARAQLALAGGYTGAKIDRATLAGWRPGAGSPTTDIVRDLPMLRERSRDQMRNAPVASGALESSVTHVVGTGLALKPTLNPALLGISEAEAETWEQGTYSRFMAWATSADCSINREHNFYALQALAFRSAWESGDSFVLTPEVVRGGRRQLALQLLEGDRVCNPNRTSNTDRLIEGIEIDPTTGEKLRAWVSKFHPGDLNVKGQEWQARQWRGSQTGRPNVLQIMRHLRPGQVRGVPWIAPIIEPLKQINRYTDAELNAAVVSSIFSVFIKMDPGAFQDIFDEDARESIVQQATGWSGEMESGKAVNLLPGESIETATPGRPNAQFDPFLTSVLRQIGMALQLPYEVLVMHFQSSYSAARGALLMAWRTFRNWRDLLTTQLCQPVYELWLSMEVADGRIRAPGFFADPVIRAAWCGAQWIGDGPGSIDPDKEVRAAKARVELGISTLDAESILHDGIPWQDKERQRAKEVATQRANGTLFTGQGAAATPADPEADEDEDDQADDSGSPPGGSSPNSSPARPGRRAALQRATDRLERGIAQSAAEQHAAVERLRADIEPVIVCLQQQISTAVDRLQATPPVVNNYVNLPEAHHEHHTHVAAPGVTFSPIIQTPEPSVTVEAHMPAPEVVVHNAVQPAPVTVQHPKQAVQTVERDENDEIVRTVTRYEG